jgi:cytoskeletal protein CcmA (bactofilin family)
MLLLLIVKGKINFNFKEFIMIKISRISSPLKDKVKNLETCSQLDGDGVFEGKYNTSGSILIRNKFLGELSADQIIVDEKGIIEGTIKSSELIVSGNVNGKINSDSIVIMENGAISGEIVYKQIAVFEGGIINVAGMKQAEKKEEKVIEIMHKVAD